MITKSLRYENSYKLSLNPDVMRTAENDNGILKSVLRTAALIK